MTDNRGIASGDVVEVFNDRGRCVVKTVVDDALPEALCYIPKGWQRSQFIEGGYQELTANRADACAWQLCLLRYGGRSQESRGVAMRYGFAIDTKRCIGCHTCAVACRYESSSSQRSLVEQDNNRGRRIYGSTRW